MNQPSEPCRHRSMDCSQIAPGFQRCACGQVFAYTSAGGAGRYVKIEDVTPADAAAFDPEMEAKFLAFFGKRQ